MVQVSRNVLPNKMQLYFVRYNKDRLRKILWSLLKEKAVKLRANRQQLPTLLGQQCWELLCLCWQWCANGCNNSQQWWPFMRGPSHKVIALLTSPKVIMCYAETFCYASKAIMEQMKMLGAVSSKVLPVWNFAQQLPKICQNIQQGKAVL